MLTAQFRRHRWLASQGPLPGHWLLPVHSTQTWLVVSQRGVPLLLQSLLVLQPMQAPVVALHAPFTPPQLLFMHATHAVGGPWTQAGVPASQLPLEPQAPQVPKTQKPLVQSVFFAQATQV